MQSLKLETIYLLNKLKFFSCCVLLLFLLASPVNAQENPPQLPVYVVQPGDTLWTIARDLHIAYGELLSQNNLTEESSIIPGARLQVPGLDGLEGELTTVNLQFGESLTSLSRSYQVPEEMIVKLNRLTSPLELYQGVSVVLVADPDQGADELSRKRIALRPGQTVLESALQANLNPWELLLENGLDGAWKLIPGEVVNHFDGGDGGPGAFPEEVENITISPSRFSQGDTVVIRIKTVPGVDLEGGFGDFGLHFFDAGEGDFVAFQGIHAKAEPGIEPLSLAGSLPDGTPLAYQQMVRIHSGNYPYEKLINIPPETIGEKVSASEQEILTSVVSRFTGQKYWKNGFGSPVPEVLSECWPSLYGNRRSFNGSGFNYFHSGLDFCGSIGVDIFSAARGEVVYTGSLTIHGNTTVIDHGWGVYTLYAHQSQIMVEEGDRVQKGDLIGKVGTTGRSTGPHLHWEVWVGGVQVDPVNWLGESYP